jgi:transposase
MRGGSPPSLELTDIVYTSGPPEGEVTASVTRTCRYYAISRHTYYIWLRRYEEHGIEGLRDRSRRPLTSPNATTGEVIGKIVCLRRTYHFGPEKISMYLNRYHDIQLGTSGVWRILKRLEMNRLPSSQRYCRHVDQWKRYEKPQPGHRVQIDVKFIAPIKGLRRRHYHPWANEIGAEVGAHGLRRTLTTMQRLLSALEADGRSQPEKESADETVRRKPVGLATRSRPKTRHTTAKYD